MSLSITDKRGNSIKLVNKHIKKEKMNTDILKYLFTINLKQLQYLSIIEFKNICRELEVLLILAP